MSIKQKTITVAGTDWILTQFPGTRGLKYKKKLLKILLPAFSQLISEGVENPMSAALSKLAEHLDDIDENLIKEIVVSGATKGTMTINFDDEFAGNYDTLFVLLKEIIIFNYESFFTLLGFAE